MYLATGLHYGNQQTDEDEFLEVEKIKLSELVDMILDGEIKDAKTQTAVFKGKRAAKTRQNQALKAKSICQYLLQHKKRHCNSKVNCSAVFAVNSLSLARRGKPMLFLRADSADAPRRNRFFVRKKRFKADEIGFAGAVGALGAAARLCCRLLKTAAKLIAPRPKANNFHKTKIGA